MIDKHLTNEEKLDAIYAMTVENHEVLKTIRRQQYISGAFRLLYWIVVLGLIGSSYYYIRPYIGMLLNNSAKIQDTVGQFNVLKAQLPDPKVLNQIMEGLQKSAVSEQ